MQVGPLREDELGEALRICNLAFATFLGIPDRFGDRDMIGPRFRAGADVLAARIGGRLIGSNVVTRWGSFGFFGPLTVLPEFWDKGVAQRMLERTLAMFDAGGVRHSGLFTFPHSAKHIGLYQKFGYWPRYLTAIMTKTTAGQPVAVRPAVAQPVLPAADHATIHEIAGRIFPGLDLSMELRSDHVIALSDAFAILRTGAGTEGGSQTCYIKFAAARDAAAFQHLLDRCEAFAAARALPVEAGVNLSRVEAYRILRARGYRTGMQGVAMHRPHEEGFNRAGVYVLDDWR